MPRPRLLVLAAALATAIAAGPVLQAGARAADPTIVVQPGDNLTVIARRTGVSISRLVELNRLANPSRIFAGQRLRIGTERSTPAATSQRVHIVNRGSTVWHIARRYGVSVGAIVEANRLANPGRIFAGQRLVIPGATAPAQGGRAAPAPAATPRQTTTVHVVARGQHLTGIARRYGVTVNAIVRANGIGDPSRIFAGQRLVIPGASTPGAASPAAPAVRPSLPASMAALMARRDGTRRMIIHAADTYGVPRAFALAVAWQESGWQQGVVSHAGAVGVMQLMPATAAWVGEAMLGRPVRMRDARSNVHAGVRLLRHYLDRYDGNRDLVLAAYYQGQSAVDRFGVYPVSRPYIASIRYLERLFGG